MAILRLELGELLLCRLELPVLRLLNLLALRQRLLRVLLCDALGLGLGAQLRIGVLQLSVGLLRCLPPPSPYRPLLLRCPP